MTGQLARGAAGSREEFDKLLGELSSDAFAERQQAKVKLRAKAGVMRPLIAEKLESQKPLDPTVRAALAGALKETVTDLLPSRVAHLMRVGAFAPGLARDARNNQRLAANSERAKDGSYTFEVRDVEIAADGVWPRFRESWDYLQDIQEGVTMSWEIAKPVAGKMRIQIEYSCSPDSSGSTIEVTAGEDTLQHETVPTKNWFDFQAITIGETTIPNGLDTFKLSLRTVKLSGYAFLNPRRVKLVPIK